MRDPYEVLGINRTASAAEIKSAYRKLARALHPDVNPGDSKAEGRFKEVSAAYDLLSDEHKKRRYDRGEIDAEGNERRRTHSAYRRNNSQGGGFGAGFGGAGFGGAGFGSAGNRRSGGQNNWWFEDLLNDDDDSPFARGTGPGGRQHTAPRKGADAHYSLQVGLVDIALGGSRQLSLNTGKTVNVKIPSGWEDGKTLRLKGMGGAGMHGGVDGDALVEIHVDPHPLFRREADDLILDLPVTLQEVLLGSKVTVPTIDGKVSVTIPEGSNTGTTLRLRGKGITKNNGSGDRGDQFCRLKIVLDNPQDPHLVAAVRKMPPDTGSALRSRLGFS